MVFGMIRDREPEPTFFNVRRLKDDLLPKFKKAKRAVRRGVVLFVDAPPPKVQDVRRRIFAGSQGFNSGVRAEPKLASYYQMNKIALSNINAKLITPQQNKIDPLKQIEIALLAKIADNLEKKEQTEEIAMSEPPEDAPEKVDAIIQAQGDLGAIVEENKVLTEQLSETRKQMKAVQDEIKVIEEDAFRDREILARKEAEDSMKMIDFVDELTKSNKEFIDDRMAPFIEVFAPPPDKPKRVIKLKRGKKTDTEQSAEETARAEARGREIDDLTQRQGREMDELLERQIDDELAELGREIVDTPTREEEAREALIESTTMERLLAKEKELAKKPESKKTVLEKTYITAKGWLTKYRNKLNDLDDDFEKSNRLDQLKSQSDDLGKTLIEKKAKKVGRGKRQEQQQKQKEITALQLQQYQLNEEIKRLTRVRMTYARESVKAEELVKNQMRKVNDLLQAIEDEDQLKAIRGGSGIGEN